MYKGTGLRYQIKSPDWPKSDNSTKILTKFDLNRKNFKMISFFVFAVELVLDIDFAFVILLVYNYIYVLQNNL